jgi:lipopolysaccharide biosynthesis protein
MTKRLFLIAGYDKNGHVNSAFVHMVHSLSEYGDCVVVMDNESTKSELKKLNSYCIYVDATRHGEYDFGSYKRAYKWAKKNLNLSDYDFVYMVNDSVYGPLFDMNEYFQKMEYSKNDAFGMVRKTGGKSEHIQSWFIGMRPSVFLSEWFDEFIMSVKKQPNKAAVATIYENGFTERLNAHNIKWDCVYHVHNRGVYNKVKKLFKQKMPFIKKLAFTRHNGSLGVQIAYVLNNLPDNLRNDIFNSACDVYGKEYMHWLLTKNPIKIFFRYVKYIITRIF